MPTKTKTKPSPDKVYVCRETVSIEIDGVPMALCAGDRRRGDDPIVRAHPDWFAPDGTPVSALPAYDPPSPTKRPPADYDVTAYEAVLPLDVLITRIPLKVRRAADDSILQLPVGTAFPRDAEIVRLHPEAFTDPKGKR